MFFESGCKDRPKSGKAIGMGYSFLMVKSLNARDWRGNFEREDLGILRGMYGISKRVYGDSFQQPYVPDSPPEFLIHLVINIIFLQPVFDVNVFSLHLTSNFILLFL